jgi:hypothetical protein
MLRVPAPYHPSCGVQPANFFLLRHGREETISVVAPSALYELEADAFANAVAQGFREILSKVVFLSFCRRHFDGIKRVG